MQWIRTTWLIGIMLLASYASAQSVEVWLQNEAASETNIIKPRFFIKNTGATAIQGFEYHFYFQADASRNVILENYYIPEASPVLENLGNGQFRVRISYPATTLVAGQIFPGVWGSVIGLHYADWSAWNKASDPSLAGVDNTFRLHSASVVLDAMGNILFGNPPPSDPGTPPPATNPSKAKIAVAFRDQALHLNNSVQPVIKLRNVGTGAIDQFELRYYFTTENSQRPILDIYHAPAGTQLLLEAKGGDEYVVRIQRTGVLLQPGEALDQGGVQFALHYADWSNWDKSNDFSYKAQSVNDHYVLNSKIPAYFAEDGQNFDIISGTEPPLMAVTGAPGTTGSTTVPNITPLITAGSFFSVALAKDGTLHSWGLNVRSNLGNSRIRSDLEAQGSTLGIHPRQITGLSDIKDVECESQHCFALRTNGDLYTWGNTDRYPVNNQGYSNSSIPLKVVGIANIKQFATTTGARNLALDNSGKVFQWGIPTNQHENWVGDPAQVPIEGALQQGESVQKVISCETWPGSYALTSTGRLLHWNRHNDTQFEVVQVPGLASIADFQCGTGSHFALNTQGEVWAWGSNYLGTLGLGSKEPVTTPTKISGLSDVKEIRSGNSHTLFRLGDGTVAGAGENRYGAIDPASSATEFLSPHFVPGVANISSIDAGDQFSVAMTQTGSVYSWGYNVDGRLGIGHQNPVSVPTLSLFNPNGLTFKTVIPSSLNSYRTLVLENNYDAERVFSVSLDDLASNNVFVVLTNLGDQWSPVSSGNGDGVVMSYQANGTQIVNPTYDNAPQFDEIAIDDEDLGPTPFPNATITTPSAGTSAFNLGDTKSWLTSDTLSKNYHPVSVTLRLQHVYDGVVFNAWVSDAAWGSNAEQLTSAKLESLMEAFAGSSDAIYEKVRSIAGEPWGTHAKPTAYIDEDLSEIHLVFYDFNSEGNPRAKGTSGYFWGANNILKAHVPYSNEALALHIHSEDAAQRQNSAILTMAHEFQHMVFFYNKNVLGTGSHPTWMNEMLSMLVEDILSEELIGFGEWDAPITQRLLYHGLNMNVNMDDWDNCGNVLLCYAAAYSLGGYLIRQTTSGYHSSDLLSFLYGTTSTGWNAMEEFMLQSELLRDMTIPEVLRVKALSHAWNLANGGAMPQHYGYPASTFGTDYNLEGRFDFWNHNWIFNGSNNTVIPIVPAIFSTPPSYLMQKGSVIWQWQTAASGDQTYSLTLPAHTWATILVEP